ncbi:MAG TPA: response regulator [Thermoanaerobaculia bacterium]|jgi:DNA-binding response OmpR family regulator|nr:response regulator [Thermoanaerobaculia bacterium]
MRGCRSNRALVIDDDDHIRELLQVLLETAGYDVDVMRDGIDAVELTEHQYAVILLDMKMPIFDGERLTDYWKLTNPAVLRRVILLSGFSRLSSRVDFGTFTVIAKPFEYRELLNAVEACVRQSRAKCADSAHVPASDTGPDCTA